MSLRTLAVGFCSGPRQSRLTHPGGAALQLVAAGAGEVTGGAVVVPVAVALHVAVVRGGQRAAAAHCARERRSTSERTHTLI